MNTLQFLQRVWTDRRAWVDLPSKVNGHWIPYSIEWPDLQFAATRITTALADDEDIYFSPAQFSSRGRRYEDVLPTYWLWADLDEVPPDVCVEQGLSPTIAWCSSPGRFQALWELDHPCSPAGIERLNRHMTYVLGADRSGWDLTQVLRVPGTRNFKYPDGPTVEIVLTTDEIYNPKELAKELKGRQPATPTDSQNGGLIQPSKDAQIPPQAKRLLKATEAEAVTGERSHQLWKLECLLLEAGFTEDAVYDLVVDTVWNKHKEVQSGERQLRREIGKALRHVSNRRSSAPPKRLGPKLPEMSERGPVPAPTSVDSVGGEPVPTEEVPAEVTAARHASPFVAYGNFLSANLEAPRWLIEELWTAKSHGMVAGEPKSLKSVLSVALGMSVASGKPFLNSKRFKVGTKGPVLVVQEENDPWRMQDLLRKMARYYKLLKLKDVEYEEAEAGDVAARTTRLAFPKDIPLHILNNYGFDMTLEEHREMLEEEIRMRDPALVILDPLYLMCGGADPNSSVQMAPFFKWLIYLKFTYGCAVLVNHHYKKQQQGGLYVRPGQRVLGSTTFHAWVASALYVENTTGEMEKQTEARLRVDREFRNVGPRRALDIHLDLGEPGDLEFSANVRQFDIEGQLIAIVEAEPGITVVQVAEILDSDKRTVMSRVRGSERLRLEGGKRGRGQSWKIFLADDDGQ